VNARILVVDDEPGIVDFVSFGLEREGFDVTSAGDGEAALDEARRRQYDVVVLDIMLPKLSGTDVCRVLRAESDVPIVMLTARDSEIDLVRGLEVGADDYVTKPFSMAELVSRVRAILRRRELDRASKGTAPLAVGDLRIDLHRHEATVGGKAVALTPSELKVLTLLAMEPGRVFSRRQIMEHLWDSPFIADERTCDVHISNLRRKLGDGAERHLIATVRGVGYKLAA
jgi:DNA-binding response OmpR family regulator